MSAILVLLAIILLGLTAVYSHQMRALHPTWMWEHYMDYVATQAQGQVPSPFAPEVALASVDQTVLLGDMLTPQPKMGLSNYDAAGCAAIDSSRQLELGGQYVQRTNNYRHTSPESCSSPLSDFVGAVYRDGVGQTVPFNGAC